MPAELAILYKEAGLPVPDIAPLTPKDKEKLQRELRKPMRSARPSEKPARKTTSPKPRVRR